MFANFHGQLPGSYWQWAPGSGRQMKNAHELSRAAAVQRQAAAEPQLRDVAGPEVSCFGALCGGARRKAYGARWNLRAKGLKLEVLSRPKSAGSLEESSLDTTAGSSCLGQLPAEV